MSQQDVDSASALEPTAGSSRNSLVTYPAVEENISSTSTMHAYERTGTPQIPDSYPESGSKHTQTTTDSHIVEPGQKADTADYLAWKSAGRPPCSQYLKSHLPPCKSSQEDIDFCQRDPEGYKLHLKSLKPTRKQKPRSNRRPGHNASQSSRPAQTHRVDTHAAHPNVPARRQAPPPTSPFLVAFMRGVAANATNDPAEIRALLVPSNTTLKVSNCPVELFHAYMRRRWRNLPQTQLSKLSSK